HDSPIFPVREEIAKEALINEAKYFAMYERSMKDPEGFWAEQAKRIDWMKPYTKIKDTTFGPGEVRIRWFYDGTTNASYNCIDRHLPEKKDTPAIIWEGDDPGVS